MEHDTRQHSGDASIKVLIGAVVILAVIVALVAVFRVDFTGRKGSGLGREFSYDIEKLGKIDPNLILYEESGNAIDTGFSEARAVFVGPDDMVYVAGDRAVNVFDSEGAKRGQVDVAGEPRCLAVGAEGKIYVGLKDHVQVYDRQGKQLGIWENLGTDAVLTSIAVYKDNVFVADAGDRVVLMYSTAGELLNRIGERDPDRNITGFVIPSPYFDLAVADDGLLRVVNPGQHRIEAYTFGGDLEFSWGKFSPKLDGFVGCCNPVNMAILPDGGFVTCEKGIVRVKVHDSDGEFVGAVAGPEQLVEGGVCRVCTLPDECQSGGFDVAVDSKGRIYVLDTLKNLVRVFSRKEGA